MSVYHSGRPQPASEPAVALAVPEAAAARLLSLSPRTLWGLRRKGDGPRHARIGGSIRYSVAELHRWLAERQSASAASEKGDVA
jgi:predicted DNA-binding transcriptional regulator AlpA